MFRQNKKEVRDFQKERKEADKIIENLPEMEAEISDLLNQINQSKLTLQELDEKIKQPATKENQSGDKNQDLPRAGR
jgi:hypothetical protein